MTELEKMQRAKTYIDKLARGINPLTDEEMSGNETLNQVRISRCLFYVSEILGKVIDNGGEVSRQVKVQQKVFSITPEEASNIEISEEAVGIAVFARRINSVIAPEAKTISAVTITSWLVKNGYLEENLRNNKREKTASKQGMLLGISTVDGVNMQGISYKKNLYNSSAQRFIVENLMNISQNDGSD